MSERMRRDGSGETSCSFTFLVFVSTKILEDSNTSAMFDDMMSYIIIIYLDLYKYDKEKLSAC